MPIIDRVGNIVTAMTRPDARPPIMATEACCVTGRTRMAYKRGGEQEARERLIEELCGTFTWLWGADLLNKAGDKVLGYVFQNKGVMFDVGKDIMRDPFKNFTQKKSNYPAKFSPRSIAMIKGAKVITALLIANMFSGFIVPKTNQAISRHLKQKRAEQAAITNENNKPVKPENTKTGAPAFTSLKTLNSFTNIIENTNTGKLIGSEVGIVGGRLYNARKPEERLDIGIRDIGSMYFYYWAQGHARQCMNLIETGGRTSQRLNPQAVNLVSQYMDDLLTAKGGKLSVNEFTELMYGTGTDKIPTELKFESEAPSKFANFMTRLGKKADAPIEAIELDKFLEALTSEQRAKYEETARRMSELQAKRCGVSILSKNQIQDILKGGELNSPKFLHKLFDVHTQGKYNSEYKYVSHKELYKHKEEVKQYIDDLIRNAKNGEIDSSLIRSMKNKNLMLNGLNFIVGISFAVLFLSTLIPKFQQYVTRRVTGQEGFPGDDNFGKNPVIKPQVNIAA